MYYVISEKEKHEIIIQLQHTLTGKFQAVVYTEEVLSVPQYLTVKVPSTVIRRNLLHLQLILFCFEGTILRPFEREVWIGFTIGQSFEADTLAQMDFLCAYRQESLHRDDM